MENLWKDKKLCPLRFLMEEMGVDVLKPFKYKGFMPLYK